MTSDLIDGEANGVHVLSMATVASAVFLHQSYQETASGLTILGVVVLLQQRNLILRVDPERVCREAATVRGDLGYVVIIIIIKPAGFTCTLPEI